MSKAVRKMKFHRLLSENDPDPFEIIVGKSDSPLLLVCEHAGQAVPSQLGLLGIRQADLNQHIGWDIGAEQVTRELARILEAPAVIQRYSRLVIDCNRPPDTRESIPEVSHGVEIPGNQNLTPEHRSAREQEIFTPFQDAVTTCLDRWAPRLVLSIHSFTPTLGGNFRHWEIGFLFRKDSETSKLLSKYVRDRHPDLTIGMNQPYQIDDLTDWFVPRHGETSGIAHSLIEIRNDQIDTLQGQDFWVQTLTDAIKFYFAEM